MLNKIMKKKTLCKKKKIKMMMKKMVEMKIRTNKRQYHRIGLNKNNSYQKLEGKTNKRVKICIYNSKKSNLLLYKKK
jgi:hypothetical protein